MSGFTHEPVMIPEVLSYLSPGPGHVIVDCTLGGGGYAEAVLCWTGAGGGLISRLIGVDRDQDAIEASAERLSGFGERLTLKRAGFEDLPAILEEEGMETVDGIMLDLGVSRHQLTSGERGFSIKNDGPLDMRMDQTRGETAAALLSRIDQRSLERGLSQFGEERYARRISKAIIKHREHNGPLRTTGELRSVIEAAVPFNRGGSGLHPATKTFMALRIMVNHELENLAAALEAIPGCLADGGRAVALSYHSLEDRLVKESFRQEAKGCTCPPAFPECVCGREPTLKILTKKPMTPGNEETSRNPAARSAKLRAASRLPRAQAVGSAGEENV